MNPNTGLPERYRIDEMLGRRSLSSAFRATDQLTGDTLVVKSLRYPDWFSKYERVFHQRRVVKSLRAAAEMHHPASASVYSVGEGAFSLYVAREWVDGLPLSTILRQQGSLPPSEAARIARKCSGAIDALAGVGMHHGGLTADNLILSEDGSVRVTDACFYDEIARFDLAGAHCDIRTRPPYTSDVAALADVLLEAMGGVQVAAQSNVTAKRVFAALRRAQRDSRAYASAASLADALTSLSSAQIVRHVWRPATATGLMAAFGTVCVFALSDEKPTQAHPISARPAATVVSIRTADRLPSEPLVTQPVLEKPMATELGANERAWLSLVIRRQGVAGLARPTVAEVFRLDADQLVTVQNLLHEQRAALANMVEQAANGSAAAGSVVRTQSIRESTNEKVLAALEPAQRDLWRSLAGSATTGLAEGEPVL